MTRVTDAVSLNEGVSSGRVERNTTAAVRLSVLSAMISYLSFADNVCSLATDFSSFYSREFGRLECTINHCGTKCKEELWQG
jgi:hypothetical protein